MTNPTARHVVAVEFSPAYLKLVEFFPSENRVTAAAIEPLERARWGNDAYLEEQLKAALARHKQALDVELVSAVAGGQAVLRIVEIPGDEANVSDALHWDMEQYLARPLDEYLMDYQALGSGESENGRLYLVVAHRRGEVKRIQRLLESTGFPLTVLDVDAFAVLNAFEANYPGMQTGRTFLVKADSHAILCIRVQNGMFSGCEIFPLETDFTGLDRVHQIRACFDNAVRIWGAIDNAVLCGDLTTEEKFRKALEAGLPIPLTCLDAFKEVVLVTGIETHAVFKPGAAQCAAALGLALRKAGDC